MHLVIFWLNKNIKYLLWAGNAEINSLPGTLQPRSPVKVPLNHCARSPPWVGLSRVGVAHAEPRGAGSSHAGCACRVPTPAGLRAPRRSPRAPLHLPLKRARAKPAPWVVLSIQREDTSTA